MSLPITKFFLISNGFVSTFHFGCESQIYVLLLKKNKTKKKLHTLSGLQNKNAPKLFILCLNSSCADYDYNAYGSPNLVHYNL